MRRYWNPHRVEMRYCPVIKRNAIMKILNTADDEVGDVYIKCYNLPKCEKELGGCLNPLVNKIDFTKKDNAVEQFQEKKFNIR